ncbi:hypothetical protein SAMD00023353_10300170 [Rosellinia necatrix]|uniref:Uncharacterized protein n=1 Tax=Rosellinia necatrix TaxID=77044 RepID=A0A1W2TXG7_ROSNE|nr:hypothetical protein SAMD00023353_10300170 [Rosellinia necatrix]
MPSFYTLATALASLSVVSANCNLDNKLDSGPLPKVRSQLCLEQGAGAYTFAMDVSELDVPTFSSGAMWAGLVGSRAFMVYDEGCALKGVYSPHQTGDCGAPYAIEEPWLPYGLIVTDVDFSSADPYFSFSYANGKYSIRNNHCVCNEIGSGLRVEQGCRCAFPIHGESKRNVLSIPFEA